MTRRQAVWLLPVVLALHNLEEGAFFPRYVPPRAWPASTRRARLDWTSDLPRNGSRSRTGYGDSAGL